RSTSDSWTLWSIGLVLSASIAALVELKIRPARGSTWELRPYAYAIAGVVVGAWAIANKNSLREQDWKWWLIPPVAAGISAAMLFFWMRWRASVGLTITTALLYFVFAYAAVRHEAGDALANWPPWWMFHSLWVCWLIAILGIPIGIGFMPDSMLRPQSRATQIVDESDTNAEVNHADD
ncbi:MAG: hypothetical protein ABI862_16365, partial [Ilumatobacteraceae bacterium]